MLCDISLCLNEMFRLHPSLKAYHIDCTDFIESKFCTDYEKGFPNSMTPILNFFIVKFFFYVVETGDIVSSLDTNQS